MMVQTPTNNGNSGVSFRPISSASKANAKNNEELLIGKYHPSIMGQLKYKEYCKGLFEEQMQQQSMSLYQNVSGGGTTAYYRTASATGQQHPQYVLA